MLTQANKSISIKCLLYNYFVVCTPFLPHIGCINKIIGTQFNLINSR